MGKKIAVIGGGVSGMAAAIQAASNGNDVTIYEHTDSLGKKLLITGNGKCNFANRDTGSSHYHSSSDMGQTAGVFSHFPAEYVPRFLERLGLVIKEKEGRLYPYTDSSRSVLDLLKLELKRLGVEVRLDHKTEEIPEGNVINGQSYDVIIIAAGGCSFGKTGSDGSWIRLLKKAGIGVIKPLPALTSVPVLEKGEVGKLKGVRCGAKVSLFIDGRFITSSKGELQPYEEGLSGICAMDVSGEAARALFDGKTAEAEVDFFPECESEELVRRFEKMSEDHPERSLKENAGCFFVEKLQNYLIHPVDTRLPDHLTEFVKRIKHSRFTVDRKITEDFKMAQVTSGGVSFAEVTKELELIKRPGVRLCGEILDVYGDCGGYNLTWAFCSGFFAGDII